MALTPINLRMEKPTYDVESSISYMTDVTLMVISQIAWYRELCPKSEFREVNVLGHMVQFLNPKSNNNVVKYLKYHLDGAFELMNFQRLRSLTIMIRDHTRTYCIESYTLCYKYDNSSPALSYSTTASSNGADCPIEYVHNCTIDLLGRIQETLTVLVQRPLPEVSTLDIKLLYYCNPGLTNYLPPGYRVQTDEEVHQKNIFLETPMKFRTGQIKSTFTSMTFHSKFAKHLIREDSLASDIDL